MLILGLCVVLWGSQTTVCRVPLWLRCWGWGTCPEKKVPSNLRFSFFSSMKTLGVSFGLVACVLGLVLGLCFADVFLVSRKPLTERWPGPSRCQDGRDPSPSPSPRALHPQPGGQC